MLCRLGRLGGEYSGELSRLGYCGDPNWLGYCGENWLGYELAGGRCPSGDVDGRPPPNAAQPIQRCRTEPAGNYQKLEVLKRELAEALVL